MQVRGFIKPSMDCVDLIHDELIRTMKLFNLDEDVKKDFKRFPNLSGRINEVVLQLLGERVQPTKDFVRRLIEIELDHINTRHPKFLKEKLKLKSDNNDEDEESCGGDENGEADSSSVFLKHLPEVDTSDPCFKVIFYNHRLGFI